ncbi:hypothetical protein [Sulfitobacter sabulilitoris]|uniref:Lipoprotein n=1 Tax=Sulfitobacter sabulilitoris TaxID=2562655 RepID=A0A5S3PK45_9RHOB|nr:hypothetical protein [Sulfitobacter sabulilitoris]TMM54717.1 hypothetical protein FDT80_03810 [Sulfitobacter sabulilitoris]
MRKTLTALMLSTLVVSGCGAIRDSRANPFNWFGRGEPTATAPVNATAANPLIPQRSGLFASARNRAAIYTGQPIDTVTDLTIERIPGGAIIRATGVPARQGVSSVRLTPATAEDVPVNGVLTYRLDAVPAPGPQPVGSVASRQVVVARKVTDQDLRGVRSIRVEAARNALESRR